MWPSQVLDCQLLRSMSETLHRKSRSNHFIVNKFYHIVTLIHDRLDGGGMVDSSKMSVAAVVRKLGKTIGHKYFSFVFFYVNILQVINLTHWRQFY